MLGKCPTHWAASLLSVFVLLFCALSCNGVLACAGLKFRFVWVFFLRLLNVRITDMCHYACINEAPHTALNLVNIPVPPASSSECHPHINPVPTAHIILLASLFPVFSLSLSCAYHWPVCVISPLSSVHHCLSLGPAWLLHASPVRFPMSLVSEHSGHTTLLLRLCHWPSLQGIVTALRQVTPLWGKSLLWPSHAYTAELTEASWASIVCELAEHVLAFSCVRICGLLHC